MEEMEQTQIELNKMEKCQYLLMLKQAIRQKDLDFCNYLCSVIDVELNDSMFTESRLLVEFFNHGGLDPRIYSNFREWLFDYEWKMLQFINDDRFHSDITTFLNFRRTDESDTQGIPFFEEDVEEVTKRFIQQLSKW